MGILLIQHRLNIYLRKESMCPGSLRTATGSYAVEFNRKALSQTTESPALEEDVQMSEENLPRPLVAPIYQGVNFTFATTKQLREATEGAFPHHFYGRMGNPTVHQAEAAIAALEKCDSALLFGSGMGAIANLVFTFVKTGDRVAVDRRVYGNAALLFKTYSPRFGFHIDWFSSLEEAQAVVRKETRLIYFESPTNPRLDIMDMAKVSELAQQNDALCVFDGTFGTPVAQNPKDFGIDIVVHSATKALNGHHDVLSGVLAGSNNLIEELRQTRTLLGANIDPHAAYMLNRGLTTVTMRVMHQNASSMALASSLESQRLGGRLGIKRVFYPGLESHPQHLLAARQMRSFGHIITLDLEGGLRRACSVADLLHEFQIAASLGGGESLVSIPSLTSHKGWTDAAMLEAGLSPGFLRLAIGFEDNKVLEQDIFRALNEVKP
jgi:cystathionine beta-lyase/cystathionine gamma-synthase